MILDFGTPTKNPKVLFSKVMNTTTKIYTFFICKKLSDWLNSEDTSILSTFKYPLKNISIAIGKLKNVNSKGVTTTNSRNLQLQLCTTDSLILYTTSLDII